ncbi:LacI family DNA-binding transcriptional regulator [Clostridium butyricum]|nr:LacI family DNA-binding transcriptional regulator [Clostridium butyricum]
MIKISTIYEIAKIAGVSPATVSKVINNYSDISDKTRKKVKKF